MSGQSYKAIIDEPRGNPDCKCDDCQLEFSYSAGHEIGDCILTPGDPSPACRCPECGTLAYLKAAS